jgi:hypothetical protein
VPSTSVEVSIDNGEIVPIGRGRYSILPANEGVCNLTVSTPDFEHRFYLRAKKIPALNPHFVTNTESFRANHVFSPEEFTDMVGFMAYPMEFDFDVGCTDVSFTLSRITVEGKREQVENKGGRFSEEVRALVQKYQDGDYYIFENIQVRCNDVSEAQSLPSISVSF